MSQKQFWNNARILAIAILLMAVAIQLLAIFVLPFRGYDSYCHIFWIGEWHRLWNEGIFYPRWLPDSFRGFGAPSFYFYPPLTFVLSSALYAVLPYLSPETIGKTLGLLAFAGSALSMWLYLRWRTTGHQVSQAKVWATLLYIFAPYRFFDYAVRGALSEHVALMVVPLVFWGIDLLAARRDSRDQRRGVALLILAFVLLILSNLPAATVTGMGAGVYVLVRGKRTVMPLLGKLGGAAIAAILLTAFYLLPVAELFNTVQLGRLWHPASVVLSSPFLAIFSGEGLLINSYAFLSLVGACILLAGYWQPKNEDHRITRGPALWMLILIVFMQLPFISQFLFNDIPPFTIVQLSYRFTILLLIVVSLSWADEIETADSGKATLRWLKCSSSLVVILWSLGSIALVLLQLGNIHLHVNKPLPVGEAPEYAPRWSRPYYDFGAALSAPFGSDSQYVVWRGEQLEVFIRDTRHPYCDSIDYNAPAAGSLLLRRTYWPTWTASIDGTPITTAPDSLGRLIISVPGGQHRVAVSLATENSARIGSYISAGTLILCLLWIVI